MTLALGSSPARSGWGFSKSSFIAAFAAVLLSVILASTQAAPQQSPNDDFARRQAQEAEQQRLKALGEMTPKPAQAEARQPATPGGQKAGPCFAITHVEIAGVRQFPASAINKVTASYANRC